MSMFYIDSLYLFDYDTLEKNGDYMVAKDSQGNMVDPIKIYSQGEHFNTYQERK